MGVPAQLRLVWFDDGKGLDTDRLLRLQGSLSFSFRSRMLCLPRIPSEPSAFSASIQLPECGGRKPIRLLKRPIETGIILKPAGKTGFANGDAALDLSADRGKAFFCQILIKAEARVFLEQVRNVGLAQVEFPGKLLDRKIFIPMLVKIGGNQSGNWLRSLILRRIRATSYLFH